MMMVHVRAELADMNVSQAHQHKNTRKVREREGERELLASAVNNSMHLISREIQTFRKSI